jgi:hypothetical protein
MVPTDDDSTVLLVNLTTVDAAALDYLCVQGGPAGVVLVGRNENGWSDWLAKECTLPIVRVASDEVGASLWAQAQDTGLGTGVEIGTAMFGARNASWCRARSSCQAVGGQSVWGTNVTGEELAKADLMIVATHMDAAAFLQDDSVGAAADMSGLIGLLAAVDALYSLSGDARAAYEKRTVEPLFAFFNGEAWSHMGSRRFARDVSAFTCSSLADKGGGCAIPYQDSMDFTSISWDRVSSVLDVDALVDVEGTQPTGLWAHVGPNNTAPSLTQAATRAGTSLHLTVTPATYGTPLPDTALSAALLPALRAAGNADAQGLLLAEYPATFDPAQQHSIFDDGRSWSNATLAFLCTSASLVARTTLLTALGEAGASLPDATLATVEANCSLVAELVDCFTVSEACPLAQRLLPSLAQQLVRAADDVPRRPSHYVSVWRPYQSLRAFNELFVRDFLYGRLARSTRGSCTASAECAAAEECVTGRCVLGTVRVHDALPLGLTYDYTTRDLLIDTDAPDLDVIVESDWKGVYMLVYRETSGLGQVALLIYSFLLAVGLGTAMHLLGRKTAE